MDWFEILKVSRNLSHKFYSKEHPHLTRKDSPTDSPPFTTSDLNDHIGFQATTKAKPIQIASAWISKLARWGYVERVGEVPNPGHKPITLYAVTQKGLEAKNTSVAEDAPQPSSPPHEDNRLLDLIEGIRAFEAARGGRIALTGKKTYNQGLAKEEKAFEDLIALCNKLESEEYGV